MDRDYAEAEKLLQESIHLCRQLGDVHGIYNALANLGIAAFASSTPRRRSPCMARRWTWRGPPATKKPWQNAE